MKVFRPSKDNLKVLREDHTREEIAEHFEVSVSTVRRWIRYYSLQRSTKGLPKPLKQKTDLDSGVTVMEKAKRILGSRLVETRQGYRLDGKPANTDVILRNAGVSLTRL